MLTDRFRRRLTTRRRLLASVAAATVGSVAGCLGTTVHRLDSRSENGGDPIALFALDPYASAFHQEQYDDYVDSLVDELRETGTVETVEESLVSDRSTGEDGYVPSYVETDDGFSRVQVHAESVTMDRWVVWLEPLDELPDNVDATPILETELSGLDEEILSEIIHKIELSVLGDRDHAAQRAPRRGVVFFNPLDPDDSDLVSDPPFEYAVLGQVSEFRRENLPVRLYVGEESVETTRYVHELDPVASSREELVAHVRSEHVDVRYSSDDLDEQRREILEESREDWYREEGSRSDAFDRILADFGLDDVALPEGEQAVYWSRYYEYDEKYYDAHYSIIH